MSLFRRKRSMISTTRPYYIAPEGKGGVDVRRDPRHEQGRARTCRLDQPRARHCDRTATRTDGNVAALRYEVRQPAEYFEHIPETKITKDMLDLAKHIVQTKSGHFDPENGEEASGREDSAS